MISSNRLGFFCMLVALASGVFGFVDNAAALNTIYEENFLGSSANNLNGSTVDVDNSGGFNTTWLAYSGYKQNGLLPTASVSQGAWLPFIPSGGNTYTLTASLTGVGVGQSASDVAWWALGFAKTLPTNAESGSGNRFIEAPTLGRAWMLFRPNNPGTNANQVQIGSATSGTGTTVPWTAGTPTGGGDVDMQIVLDTTASTWTGSFYAKRPTDSLYTFITTQNILQDITGIGLTRTTATAGTVLNGMINHFKLETSGSVFLAGDVNGDALINDADFNIIRDHLFSSGTRAQGDLTNDGTVDFRDFRAWKVAHEGAGSGASISSGVPEPTGGVLLLIAASGIFMSRRRPARTVTVS
jgi:hypothetical protein